MSTGCVTNKNKGGGGTREKSKDRTLPLRLLTTTPLSADNDLKSTGLSMRGRRKLTVPLEKDLLLGHVLRVVNSSASEQSVSARFQLSDVSLMGGDTRAELHQPPRVQISRQFTLVGQNRVALRPCNIRHGSVKDRLRAL
jgi:hypothetical protein